MPFPFPSLWSPASVYAPKVDLNPVPGGQADNYWASVESNFVSSSLVTVSSSLAASEDAINSLSASAMLNLAPTVTAAYTASYSSGLLSSEVWRVGGTRIKQEDYAYIGVALAQAVSTVYDPADGTTVLAQETVSYFYSGTALVSASLVRNV